MKRTASAEWKGGLKDGRGTLSTESGVLKTVPYSFGTRFENEKGSNPEELIAAAHAGCFSMALSVELEKSGFKPESLKTVAAVKLKKGEEGFSISNVHLELVAKIPDIDQDTFMDAAEAAKLGCPVSRLLNAEISMEAKLLK